MLKRAKNGSHVHTKARFSALFKNFDLLTDGLQWPVEMWATRIALCLSLRPCLLHQLLNIYLNSWTFIFALCLVI